MAYKAIDFDQIKFLTWSSKFQYYRTQNKLIAIFLDDINGEKQRKVHVRMGFRSRKHNYVVHLVRNYKWKTKENSLY